MICSVLASSASAMNKQAAAGQAAETTANSSAGASMMVPESGITSTENGEKQVYKNLDFSFPDIPELSFNVCYYLQEKVPLK